MERLIYFFLRALRNMRQCPLLCGVAVGTAAVALTIIAFFALVVINVQQLTAHIGEQVEIVAYLDPVPEAGALKVLRGRTSCSMSSGIPIRSSITTARITIIW